MSVEECNLTMFAGIFCTQIKVYHLTLPLNEPQMNKLYCVHQNTFSCKCVYDTKHLPY